MFSKPSEKLAQEREKLAQEGLNFLLQYPEDQLPRLLVDGCLYAPKGYQLPNGLLPQVHGKGEQITDYEDREPGCFKAFFEALQLIIEHINKEVDIELALKLHLLCAGKVEKINASPGKFRGTDGQQSTVTLIGLTKERCSVQGIMELLKWIHRVGNDAMLTTPMKNNPGSPDVMKGYDADALSHIISDEQKLREKAEEIYTDMDHQKYLYVAPSYIGENGEDVLKINFQSITENYKKSIKEVTQDDDQLRVIVQCIQDYERLHPFKDVNNRVFIDLIGSLLLMQNGYPPPTFYEPNAFDVYSVDELVPILKAAIETTKSIIKGEEKIFDYVISPEEKEKCRQLLSEFALFLSEKKKPLVVDVKLK